MAVCRDGGSVWNGTGLRQLVLAADVAGYSRLMGADEEGVLVGLKAPRKSPC